MMRVDLKCEPESFDNNVRKPGQNYINRLKDGEKIKWEGHAYWKNCIDDLYQAYDGICAYSCSRILRDSSYPTVDHFIPKHQNRYLAYEWTNFRLASPVTNTNKGKWENIIDPCEVQPGWFILNFPSLLITPNKDLDEVHKNKIKYTVEKLKLNFDNPFVNSRLAFIQQYCLGKFDFEHLRFMRPFIAFEIERQELCGRIREIMGFTN